MLSFNILWHRYQKENILHEEKASVLQRVSSLYPNLFFAKIVKNQNSATEFVRNAENSLTIIMDPRHTKRIHITQNLFAYSFGEALNSLPYPLDEKTKEIIKFIDKIDSYIVTHAPRFPIDKIAKTDLSILRLSIYELLVEKKLPEKVIINEAVELAKELSGDRSFAFVNAVLGKILTQLSKPNV